MSVTSVVRAQLVAKQSHAAAAAKSKLTPRDLIPGHTALCPPAMEHTRGTPGLHRSDGAIQGFSSLHLPRDIPNAAVQALYAPAHTAK